MRRRIKDIFIENKVVNFSPHSCRAASSSKVKCIDVNIDEIIKEAVGKTGKTFSYIMTKKLQNMRWMIQTSIKFVELIIMYDFYIVLLINWC